MKKSAFSLFIIIGFVVLGVIMIAFDSTAAVDATLFLVALISFNNGISQYKQNKVVGIISFLLGLILLMIGISKFI
ncbi:hypothetical protein [Priestia flexa]|uniref:hypothetical protein n=1 Tax=Priestia flexa TaxID=86664 RepID=UPI00288FB005|nr:hypothetical protein [Priestia flexa]MDT2045888.1 hypothetical protein [Priestia flexa]